ncbi:hypothetical protein KHP62_18030 [Rhodobacteraceae bacterium NNCM2]|nr:hypothetical protein [Coraliihabitans acroporae]
MHEFVATGLAAATVHLATNIDNLLVLTALVLASSRGWPVAAYATVQAGVVVAAWAVSLLAAGAVHPDWIGFIGIVPICLGLRQLFKREAAEATAGEAPGDMLSLLGLFAAMSADTFSVFLALWSDTRHSLDGAIGAGAAVSLVGLCLLGVFAARLGRPVASRLAMLDRVAPYIMIASGTYVLLDTATDISNGM